MTATRETPTILFVEDDNASFCLIEEILHNKNIKLLHTQYGNEAIQQVEQNEFIDIVLIDIKLPDIDGFRVTKKIKAIKPNLPVLAVSACVSGTEISRCFMYGCDDFIEKPVNINIFLEKLKRYIPI